MKIVVVGLGKVGKALAKQLSLDQHNVIVIDSEASLVEDTINVLDVMGVCGNGASCDIQLEAGVGSADLLIAATSSDEINILSCLVAKKLGVGHTIARVRNPEYERQLRFMREELGLSMSINPEKAVAKEISRVLRFPSAVKVESFSKGRIELVEYRIGEENPLDGKKVMEIATGFKLHVLICAVNRGGEITIPKGDFCLQTGDTIYLTGSPADLEQLFRKLGLFKAKAKNVMIVGASKMGYYLAHELSDTGMNIRLIDNDEERCRKMSELLPGTLMIVGDGTDSELLSEEGINEMDAFVALTGLDETNILLAMYAAGHNVDKVVAKVNRKSFAEFVNNGQMVDTVVSTCTVVSEMILQYIRAMQNSQGTKVKTMHRLADGKVDVLEFPAGDELPFTGIPFRELNIRKNILIAGIVRRNGQILIPGGNDCIESGDDVLVATNNPDMQDLRDIVQ